MLHRSKRTPKFGTDLRLDAMTDGGLGIVVPQFDNTRYFYPFRPIKVSPIGLSFFSARIRCNLERALVALHSCHHHRRRDPLLP